jgi:phage shock protein A
MQARAGAIDELLASGALEDLSTPVDDIQKELDKVSSTNQVDNELAALKAELGTGGASTAELGAGGAGAGAGAVAASAETSGAGADASAEAAGTGGNGTGASGGDNT